MLRQLLFWERDGGLWRDSHVAQDPAMNRESVFLRRSQDLDSLKSAEVWELVYGFTK